MRWNGEINVLMVLLLGGVPPTMAKETSAESLMEAKSAIEGSAGSEVLTGEDQNKSDLALTSKIRQAMMADESLSVVAKNVKIITVDGRVTLRGLVKTPGEKDTIGRHARTLAGDAKVDDLLDVKS